MKTLTLILCLLSHFGVCQYNSIKRDTLKTISWRPKPDSVITPKDTMVQSVEVKVEEPEQEPDTFKMEVPKYIALAQNIYIDSLYIKELKSNARAAQVRWEKSKSNYKIILNEIQSESESDAILALGVLLIALIYPVLDFTGRTRKGALALSLLLAIWSLPGPLSSQALKYRVTAVSKDGTDTFTSNIATPFTKDSTQVHIPGVFSPDGDGINEVFLPKLKNCPYFLIDLYTKEGEYITTLRENQSWKGLGKPQTYIWLAEWKTHTGALVHRAGYIVELHSETK